MLVFSCFIFSPFVYRFELFGKRNIATNPSLPNYRSVMLTYHVNSMHCSFVTNKNIDVNLFCRVVDPNQEPRNERGNVFLVYFFLFIFTTKGKKIAIKLLL
jgi:hypothetical protein